MTRDIKYKISVWTSHYSLSFTYFSMFIAVDMLILLLAYFRNEKSVKEREKENDCEREMNYGSFCSYFVLIKIIELH